jgi:hypothetical protein
MRFKNYMGKWRTPIFRGLNGRSNEQKVEPIGPKLGELNAKQNSPVYRGPPVTNAKSLLVIAPVFCRCSKQIKNK